MYMSNILYQRRRTSIHSDGRSNSPGIVLVNYYENFNLCRTQIMIHVYCPRIKHMQHLNTISERTFQNRN